MKKFLIIAFICVISTIIFTAFVFALSSRQFTATEVDFRIVIDGEERNFDRPIVTIDGRTYLPIREFCNSTGYNVYWEDQKREIFMLDTKNSVFKDDTFNSREGTLQNGRKYFFYGADYNFSMEGFCNINNYSLTSIHTMKVQGETIEAIAEKIQSLNGLSDNPPENLGLNIYYDVEQNALAFITNSYGKLGTDSPTVIVVKCEDGLTTRYNLNR